MKFVCCLLPHSCSLFVKRNKVLDFFDGHWLGDELNLNFAALFKHALGAGRGAGVNIDFHLGGLLQ